MQTWAPGRFTHLPGCPWEDGDRLRAALQDPRFKRASGAGYVHVSSNDTTPAGGITGITRRLGAGTQPAPSIPPMPGRAQKGSRVHGKGKNGGKRRGYTITARSSRATGVRVDAEIGYAIAGIAPVGYRWHPWTARYLAACRDSGITLIGTQLVVGDPEMRMATEVDDIGIVGSGWTPPSNQGDGGVRRSNPHHTATQSEGGSRRNRSTCGCTVIFIERKTGYDAVSANEQHRPAVCPRDGQAFEWAREDPTRQTLTITHFLQTATAQIFYERKCEALRALHGRKIRFPLVRSILVYVSARDARAAREYRADHPGAAMSLAVARGLLPTRREGGAGDGTCVQWVTDSQLGWDTLSYDRRLQYITNALRTPMSIEDA